MRKLLVSNFQTLDGYYELNDKTFDRFFDYFLEEYGNNEAFDVYNRDLQRGLRATRLHVKQQRCAAPGPKPSARAEWRSDHMHIRAAEAVGQVPRSNHVREQATLRRGPAGVDSLWPHALERPTLTV